MLKLRPQILKKNGRNQFVIISYDEFRAIQEALEDADDLRVLQQAREKDDRSAPGYTLEEVEMRLGLDDKRRRRRKLARRR